MIRSLLGSGSAAAIAVLALAAAGCGGDDDGLSRSVELAQCLEDDGHEIEVLLVGRVPDVSSVADEASGYVEVETEDALVAATVFGDAATAERLEGDVQSGDRPPEAVADAVVAVYGDPDDETGAIDDLRSCLGEAAEGDDDREPEPADAGEPDGGESESDDRETGSGDGYSLVVPAGWSEGGDIPGFDVDLLIIEGDGGGEFTTNLNVIVEDLRAEIEDLDDLLDYGEAVLERIAEGAPRSLPERDLDGEPAAGLVADAEQFGQRQTTYQRYVLRAERIYTITLTVPRGDPDAESLFERILDGWSWDG